MGEAPSVDSNLFVEVICSTHMATSSVVTWAQSIPLLAASFSFLGSVAGGLLVWVLNQNRGSYERLYGPLRFNLQMMKLMNLNQEEVLKTIKEWQSVEMQINLMSKHLPPLTMRWIKYVDTVRNLFEENPGLIKKRDFALVRDFMDGCIKRDITENGRNVLAIDEARRNRLLQSVEALQKRFLEVDAC